MAVAVTPDLEHMEAEEVLAYMTERFHPRLYVACLRSASSALSTRP